MQTSTTKLRKRSSPSIRKPTASSVHWLFRSNIPRRRTSFLPTDIRKRNFFGMGEMLGVLTNPAETVRSLSESKRLLENARKEVTESRERTQLRTKHMFSRLPGFFSRPAEIQAIKRSLEGEPSFTVLFGANSVGKTALLREVLCCDNYHVLHFDLRIAGFADLASLYMSLSQQMEQYYEEIADEMEGYEEFEKEALIFKHDRINVERRASAAGSGSIKTSDIARLMELFQSSLLKYWEFQPFEDCYSGSRQNGNHSHRKRGPRQQDSDAMSDKTHVDPGPNGKPSPPKSKRWRFRVRGKGKGNKASPLSQPDQVEAEQENNESVKEPKKKMPVIFFDEAHKLPSLMQSTDAMKCLLDAMLVLTKQDRLCHVIHATSDPFYQTWLRQLNVMQHCKIITIGDCSKAETHAYFRETVLPRVPDQLHRGLDFERLYEAFGGKLTHWQDYVTDYINSNGNLDLKQSSHFIQAHALLNLHIIHSSQSSTPTGSAGDPSQPQTTSTATTLAPSPETLHPALGPAGLKIYSPPATYPHRLSTYYAAFYNDDRSTAMVAGYYSADFTAMQLLKVMSRLTQPGVGYLSYFLLCRELGVRAVDGMVRARVLDLRWTECVTKEGGEIGGNRAGSGLGGIEVGDVSLGGGMVTPIGETGGNGIAMNTGTGTGTEEEDIVPVSERELGQSHPRANYHVYVDEEEAEDIEVVGPKLVATTPIMRFAMREVVEEYEDEQSISEYASLSDVDEY